MHRATYPFIKTLHIPSVMKTNGTLQAVAEDLGDGDDLDIDISTEIDASADDVAVMASTTATDFEPGDILGKLLAFVNQVHMSSEGVRAYLEHVCAVNQLKPIKLCLWVRTRWGSMSHCLESALAIQKVSSYGYVRSSPSVLTFLPRPLIIFVSPPTPMRIFCRSKKGVGLTISLLPLNGSKLNLYTTVLRYRSFISIQLLSD